MFPIAPLVFQEIFVTIRFYSYHPTALALLTTLLWAAQASAQSLSAPAVAPAAMAADTAAPAYRSAFDGYQHYTEEKTSSWKESNDTAGQIGGWREYAKEAGETQKPEVVVKPEAGAAPGQK